MRRPLLGSWTLVVGVAILLASPDAIGGTTRLKDVASLQGVVATPMLGYGLVVGLNKTGDRRQTIFSAQTLASMLQRFGVSVDAEAIVDRALAA